MEHYSRKFDLVPHDYNLNYNNFQDTIIFDILRAVSKLNQP